MAKTYFSLLLVFLIGLRISAQTVTLTSNVKTPYKNTVPDTYILSNYQNRVFTDEQLAAISAHLYNNYGGATIIGDEDYRYNCHAYAWHVSKGGDYAWIGWNTNTAEDTYWTDKSYIAVNENEATIVSYNEQGNHSAIKDTGVWYKSKWGMSFLVKHKLNEVLNGTYFPYLGTTNYHPELTKTFYRRATISGYSLISSSCVYEIEELPVGYTVNWSLSDSYYNLNCLQQNTPSTNKCRIIRSSSQDMSDATLTATIKKNGVTVCTLTKQHLYAHAGFKGTYFNGQTIKQINLPTPLYFHTNKTNASITSPNLKEASVSFWTTMPWSLDTYNGILLFNTPSSSSTNALHVDCSNGDGYDLTIITTTNSNLLNVIMSESQMEVSLVPIESIEALFPKNNTDLTSTKTEKTDIQVWTLEINSATTGERMLSQKVDGPVLYVNTTTWKSGVYLVTATIGEDTITEKVIIK